MIPPRYSSSFALHPSFFGIFFGKTHQALKKKHFTDTDDIREERLAPKFSLRRKPTNGLAHVFHVFGGACLIPNTKSIPTFFDVWISPELE